MCLFIATIVCFLLQPLCMGIQRESEGKQNMHCRMVPQSPLRILREQASEAGPQTDGEVDKKLRTVGKLTIFKFTSRGKEALQNRLTELFESFTPLSLVCVELALDYCRCWKKNAEVRALGESSYKKIKESSPVHLAYSPKGDCYVASVVSDPKAVVIVDMESYDTIATIPIDTDFLSFSPDGHYIIAAYTRVSPGAISLLHNSYDVQE